MQRSSILALLILLWASPSWAQVLVVEGGTDLRGYRPPFDGHGMLATHRSSTLGHLELGQALTIDHADSVLEFTAADGTSVDVVGARTTVDVAIALGLFHRASAYARLPVTLSQARTGVGLSGGSNSGIADLEIGAKWEALPLSDYPVGLAAVAWLGLPTGEEESLMGYGQPTAGFLAVIDGRPTDGLSLAANIGFAVTGGARIGSVPLKHPLLYRFGASYRPWPVGRDWEFMLELFGQTVAKRPFRSARQSPVELLAGARRYFGRRWDIQMGLGTGLNAGLGTPDYRFVVGANWRPFTDEPSPDCNAPKDSDADGLTDDLDQAPYLAEDPDGFQDDDGIPDPDNDLDGVGDADDPCPNRAAVEGGKRKGCPPEEVHSNQNGDGAEQDLDLDPDADSIAGDDDRCPLEPEDFDSFEDSDGCPEIDNDSDGVPDGDDRCPLVAGAAADKGCPIGDLKVGNRLAVTQSLRFQVNSAVLDVEASREVLLQMVSLLQGNPEILRLEVQGHTDATGDPEANLALSSGRAQAVMAYLIEQGVAAERLSAQGYGQEQPVASNETPSGRSQNRRVDLMILELVPVP